MPPFWAAVAQCETGSRWDWGKQHRRGEGHLYEGALGFAASSWSYYAPRAGVHKAHAYLASPMEQVRVGRYLLARGGYWGCLHGSHAWILSLPGR